MKSTDIMEKLILANAVHCESTVNSDPHTIQVTKQEDVAVRFARSHAETILTPKEEIRCRRKVDFHPHAYDAGLFQLTIC